MRRLVYPTILLLGTWLATGASEALAQAPCPTLPGTTMRDFRKLCADSQSKVIPIAQTENTTRKDPSREVRNDGNSAHLRDSPVTGSFSVSECEAQIVANKSFQILKGKLDLLYTANPSIEILANSKVPSKTEKAAISLWVEEQKRCSAPGIAYYRSQSPEVGAIYERAYTEMYISAADLYQGKISYGEFAKAGVRRHQEIRERIGVLVSKAEEARAEKDRIEARAIELEQERQRELLAQRYEAQSRQEEIERQRRLQILMMLQQQQQGQQLYQQQREDYLDQACLNRARNQIERAQCSIEKGGRQIGGALLR